jgi:hypothetical protein
MAVALASAFAQQARAHHSFAAYDMATTKTISGTLKEVDWNAPHAGFTVSYRNEKGEDVDVAVSTVVPTAIVRQGFSPKDLKVGMKVELSWHPNRNGLPGGDMESLKLEDGRIVKGGGLPPPSPPAAAAASK